MVVQKILYLTLVILALTLVVNSSSSSCKQEDKEFSFLNDSLVSQREMSSRIFEDQIKEVFEQLRELIKKGVTIGPITIPLDPLRIPFFPILLPKNELICGCALLTSIQLEGLAGFELTDVSITISGTTATLILGLNFPQVRFSTNYFAANFKLADMINLYGSNGRADIKLNNLNINTKIDISAVRISGSLSFYLRIARLDLEVTLPQTEANITGVFNEDRISRLISEQLSDTLQSLAKEEHRNINNLLYNIIWAFIEEVLNPCLENTKLEDIPGIIEGSKKFCDKTVEELNHVLATNIRKSLCVVDDYNMYNIIDLLKQCQCNS